MDESGTIRTDERGRYKIIRVMKSMKVKGKEIIAKVVY